MKVIVGIDIGGSTTKICAIENNNGRRLISPLTVKATDPVTSLYGAFGKLTSENGLTLSDIERVMVTGVGSSFADESLYGLPCVPVSEFSAVGLGGLYLTGLDEAVVVSMGTGTAVVHAKKGRPAEYLGGTGVGGGTLTGLARLLLKMDDVDHLSQLAKEGSLDKIDLRIRDIAKSDVLSMRGELTAANFGKVSDLATPADMALGLFNMVYETVGMVSLFAARSRGLSDIVLLGNLTEIPQARTVFDNLSDIFGVRFVIPERSAYGTVIGTALF